MVHDVLDPDEYPKWPLSRTMENVFRRTDDLIVCGHSHVESIKRYDNVLVINPGSPTFPHNYSAQPGTVAVLTLEENRGGGDCLRFEDTRSAAGVGSDFLTGGPKDCEQRNADCGMSREPAGRVSISIPIRHSATPSPLPAL
jgi:hypothetical protein